MENKTPEFALINPDGTLEDAALHEEMLSDEDAARVSAYFAVLDAIQNQGMSPEDAEKFYGYKKYVNGQLVSNEEE